LNAIALDALIGSSVNAGWDIREFYQSFGRCAHELATPVSVTSIESAVSEAGHFCYHPVMSEKDFTEFSVSLPPNHGWRCKPGNELFIADRGAVAFEIPRGWVLKHQTEGTVSLPDKAPPADEARLALTIFYLPPVAGGWGQLSLEEMMRADEEDRGKSRKKRRKTPLQLHSEKRLEHDLVWAEKGTMPDPANGRLIRCRQLMARARLVQVLITYEVYKDVSQRYEPVWQELLRSLQVAIPRDITGHIGN
jgi:hypothetical protein